MEVISIERSTYEELLTSFNSFVAQMKAMAVKGTDKRLGGWLNNQDGCQIQNISPRTLQTLRQNGTLGYSQIEHKTYYKPGGAVNRHTSHYRHQTVVPSPRLNVSGSLHSPYSCSRRTKC